MNNCTTFYLSEVIIKTQCTVFILECFADHANISPKFKIFINTVLQHFKMII